MRTFAFLVATATITTVAPAATRPSVPPAKLTQAQARVIALKRAPGTLIAAEYEKEGGVWRYSFDIHQRGRKGIHEIGVDANSGRIVEDSFEHADAKN